MGPQYVHSFDDKVVVMVENVGSSDNDSLSHKLLTVLITGADTFSRIPEPSLVLQHKTIVAM